ncbi:MAG TPA: hypothetical protein VJW23_10210 [Propionibacteriaceae bacterium]|nr:hypothetical protein [Propionibacteriaceae bacterium]
MTLPTVGPTVGEIAALPAGSGATLTDTGLGYDVAIGGLGFKLKISDDNPYERATAQFKKDQFDNSTEYGDQSLLGYWTKGQFSFHKGAGVKYYDTTDGETVLNRYRTGVGVDPFAPGETTLQKEWINTTSGSWGGPIVYGGAGNGFLVVRDSFVVRYATSLTGPITDYTPTVGTATGVTVGPLCAYVTTSSNKIERVGIAGGAPSSAAIYTHSTGFRNIFYAKDRLWAVDTNNTWYQLDPNPAAPPVAIAAGDKVFTLNDDWGNSICLTDTPGPVLIGNGGRIYSVTLSTSGVVPSMSGPVQVAELPVGEAIRGLAYHLGFLAMTTTLGVRIGVVSDVGQVTYGPLLIEWAASELGAFTSIARKGSSVFVTGNASVYEVNLSEQVGDGLEFAWAQLPDPYTDFPVNVAGATAYGVFTWAGNTLVAWAGKASGPPAGSMKHESSNLCGSGYLYTGLHRFGTLEPKKFHTVKMKCSGASGAVTVYKVLSDGSEVSLLTVDLATSTGEDQIALGMDSPTELVGLKFVLTRSAGDPTVGPTLLGYQLRALPAPRRQRLIRFPLMLMDVERRGSSRAVGYVGSAWDRLAALEDMEASGGVFQFQDFRTGEAGTCYIESVEHRGVTPPGKGNDGFGGIVMLTIRKL